MGIPETVEFRGQKISPKEKKTIMNIEQEIRQDVPNFRRIPNIVYRFSAQNGTVTSLEIRNIGINNVPKSIVNFKNLTRLTLSGNKLETLPDEICRLKTVQFLHVHGNKLTQLPECIGEMDALYSLDISSNKLTTLPLSLLNLSNLRLNDFRFSRNPLSKDAWDVLEQLRGESPELAELSNVEKEAFRDIEMATGKLIRVNGAVSLRMKTRDGHIVELVLDHQSLTELPDSIGNFSHLEKLDVQRNELTYLPDSIGKLKRLTELILYWNRLDTLPETIGNLECLEKLDLSENDIDYLPKSIFKLSNLVEVRFKERIREKIGELEKKSIMDFVEENIRRIKNEKSSETKEFLEGLNIHSQDAHVLQKLMITDYKNIKHHVKLENHRVVSINIQMTEMQTLPDSLGELDQLRTLYLTHNKIKVIPESIGNLVNLKSLYLAGNKIEHLPESIGNLISLQHLGLGSKYTGNPLKSLPYSIGQLENLRKITVQQENLDLFTRKMRRHLKSIKCKVLYETRTWVGGPEGGREDVTFNATEKWEDLELEEKVMQFLDEFEEEIKSYFPIHPHSQWRSPVEFGFKIEDNNIIELGLFNKGLTSVPRSICKLSHLRILNLASNKLKTIPKCIGKLSELQELNLASNKLNSLPKTIKDLLNLNLLNLEDNKIPSYVLNNAFLNDSDAQFLVDLEEVIAEEIPNLVVTRGNFGYRARNERIVELLLQRNKLGKFLDQIETLIDLRVLNLTSCELNSIPDSICKLSNLQELVLEDNKISELPSELSKLENLEILNMKKNNFASFPEQIIELYCLKNLNLDENGIKTIPGSIEKLNNLEVLSLRYNKITMLPDEIAELQKLRKISLDRNKIRSLPESIGNLKNLQILNLNYNKLSTLPEFVGNLPLIELILFANQLTSLPDNIGKLVNLKQLQLWRNRLTSLPKSLGKLVKLQSLFLHKNRLTSLPESIGKLANLRQLYLNNNQLDTLPESIGKLANLRQLYLNNNQLEPLPERLEKWISDLKKKNCEIQMGRSTFRKKKVK